jgi:hypothetical protein
MAHLCGLCLALRRDHGQFARVVTNYDGLGAHPAQRARACRAPGPGRGLGLSLRQDRDEQPVVVGDDPRELTVVTAQGEAQPAQVRHPLGGEALTEPVTAGPDYSEHDDPP